MQIRLLFYVACRRIGAQAIIQIYYELFWRFRKRFDA